ncbi:MAG: hypothetical protein V1800_00385 [Candidatus Latescibacterota bacterium]
MANISRTQPEAEWKSGMLYFWKGAATRWEALPIGGISTRECSFYFLMSGVFYLVLGAVLMAGFSGIGTTGIPWFQWQPQIMLLISLLFIVLGVALGRGGSAAVKTVKSVTLFYIAFVVVNGISVQTVLPLPKAFTAGFILSGAVMGLLLIVALQKTAGRVRS